MIPPTLTKCYSKVAHAFLYTLMDFFQSHNKLCPSRCYLTFFHIPERSTSKTTGWFTKGLKLIPTCPANKVLLKVAHAFLYTLMDFFQSHIKLCPSRCYLTFFHSRTFNCTSKTTGWFTKESWNWSLTLTKVLLQGAHAFLYTLMDFFQSHQTVPKPLLSYLLPYSRTFNCTSKTTGWFTGLKLILPHANKVLLQGSTRILIYIDGLLCRKLCPAVAILPSLPERSILVKLAGSPKELKLIPTCPANKVLLQGSAFLYTWMDFFQSHKLCPSRCYLTSSIFPTFNCTSKTTGWFTKGLKLITLTKCYSR
jgi:hypothetical protein